MVKINPLFNALVIASSTAFMLATPVVILVFVGLYLDNRFQTTPIFLIGGILTGFVCGIINTFKLLKSLRIL